VVRRVGLFEYLAVDADIGALAATHITETDGDEYDAPDLSVFVEGSADPDARFGTIKGVPQWDTRDWRRDSTLETRTDGDTYDDDPAVGAISMPNRWSDSTRKTSSDSDTYDEGAHYDALGIPMAFQGSTRSTKVDNETYDDDPGIHGLAIPD
jgi:hypothetical protein